MLICLDMCSPVTHLTIVDNVSIYAGISGSICLRFDYIKSFPNTKLRWVSRANI